MSGCADTGIYRKKESNRCACSSTEVSQEGAYNTQSKTSKVRSEVSQHFPSNTAAHWSGSLLFIAILLKINKAAPPLSFHHFDHKKFFVSSGEKIEFPRTSSLPCKCSAAPYRDTEHQTMNLS